MSPCLFRPLRWLALLCAAGLAGAAHAQGAAEPGVFDRLFGNDRAAERAGKASDGLALPALFADGKLIVDALPLHDLGPGEGACVAIVPLLEALEVAHRADAETMGLRITLPDPRRDVTLPDEALLPSPSGQCLMLADIAQYLPLSLTHDTVSQRLLLEARAPLPVLMRLIREERQARIRSETIRPDFPLLARPAAAAQLWSADLAANLVHAPQGSQMSATLVASGAILGLAGGASVSRTGDGRMVAGFTMSEARDTPNLLGPLGARSIALGDIAAPGQPMIADALSGRGLVISSRPPWRADLVDEITLSGALPTGWEAELWNEERLIAVTRDPDAAGNWQFGGLPVRLGENRWVVRLYGPNGEVSEQVFTRLVGAAMNGENEVDYAFGVVDGGRPLLGDPLIATPAGPTAFATVGWGVTSDMTARLDLRAGLDGEPALALGLNGALAGGLWAATAVRDRVGSLGAAVRLARRVGAQDIVVDLAQHGDDDGPGLPPLVREFSQVVTVNGQGRIGLGRLSLPWQARVQSGELRRGDSRHVAAARLVLPMADWQANLAFGGVRDGTAPWQGTAALGVTARRGNWRLRGGVNAVDQQGWRLEGGNLSASRNLGKGALAVDLNWQADSGRLDGGVSFSQQLGPFGLSAAMGREGMGWRAGLGLTMGLWRGPNRWHSTEAGIARSGAILAEMFVDEDGDGQRGADEHGVEGGRLIVGAALRRESTNARGEVLIRGLPAGPSVDIETQMSSLDDFTLRPERAGDRIALRPGEVRHVLVPLRPTGSVEVQVVLIAGDRRTPRSGVPVVLRNGAGQEIARAITDFDGYVLFDGLAFGSWQAAAAGQVSPVIDVTRGDPDQRTRILIAPEASAPSASSEVPPADSPARLG